MDEMSDKARAMALKGAAILDGCQDTGNWPAMMTKVDFRAEESTPAALIAPNSRIDEALGMLGITYQVAHDSLLVRRGDIPPDIAAQAWKIVAGEYQISSART